MAPEDEHEAEHQHLVRCFRFVHQRVTRYLHARLLQLP